MTANSLVKPAGFGLGDEVSSAQLQALQEQAGQSVNRNSSANGYINYPIAYGGSNSATTVGWLINGSGKIALVNTVAYVMIPLDRLPDGHTLTQLRMHLTPAGGHGGQPAALPGLTLQRTNLSGTVSTLGTVSYTWVDVPTYELGFYLAIGGLMHTVDSDYRYSLVLDVEHDTNSVNGCILDTLEIDMTIDDSYGGTDISIWKA